MESDISPAACITFLEQFDTSALQSCCPNIGPTVWFRYVGDVVEAINKDVVD